VPHPRSHATGLSLRERKRRRTRQAIVDAATDLFVRNGYEQTTVADIAAAADIGTRTFFSYFASKEELLFPEGDARARAAREAIAARRPGDGPIEVLLQVLGDITATSNDMVGPLAALRMQLIRTMPAVRGRAVQLQQDVQREIARQLAEAYPDELDEVGAAALVGAFVGAVTGALEVLLADGGTDPEQVRDRLRQATAVALRPWMRATGRAGMAERPET
jgi:AcrR family transcriptional regulator